MTGVGGVANAEDSYTTVALHDLGVRGISVGIVAPLVGQASSRGAQIFGTARTLHREDPESEGYWEAFRWQSDHVERGRDLTDPPTDPLIVVTAKRIVYTEHWLRRSGYRPRQVWRPAG